MVRFSSMAIKRRNLGCRFLSDAKFIMCEWCAECDFARPGVLQSDRLYKHSHFTCNSAIQRSGLRIFHHGICNFFGNHCRETRVLRSSCCQGPGASAPVGIHSAGIFATETKSAKEDFPFSIIMTTPSPSGLTAKSEYPAKSGQRVFPALQLRP